MAACLSLFIPLGGVVRLQLCMILGDTAVTVDSLEVVKRLASRESRIFLKACTP